MGNVEILLATMHREDPHAVLQEMNIQTDIVIANQAGRFAFDTPDCGGISVKMLTTADRGVGRNRNLALSLSSAEFILFADDDLYYVNGYAEIVQRAFQRIPQADIIVFDVEEVGERAIDRTIAKTSRVRLWNFSRYGTVRIAMRRASWQADPFCFSERFGGGAIYGSGEDTLFLREALRKGFRIYSCPERIARTDQRESTWFSGYNVKFFFDKGALVAAAFPMMAPVFWLYFLMRFARKSKLGLLSCARMMRAGMRNEKSSISFAQWSQKHGV